MVQSLIQVKLTNFHLQINPYCNAAACRERTSVSSGVKSPKKHRKNAP
ncbi:MAG: hypothetical protein OFPII_09650 [Osedax symbiont Rs1]|nr:MAG: hypothetical protein OFPII_09650 [Osedax symbiont Rs1]